MNLTCEQIQAIFEERLTPQIQRQFTDIVCEAYQSASSGRRAVEDEVPENTSYDEFWYGNTIYRNLMGILSRLHISEDSIIEFFEGWPRIMRAVIGPISLTPYRVRRPTEDSYENCFPYNNNGAKKLTQQNLQSSLFHKERHINAILAHAGDHLVGLTHLFIGVPIQFDHAGRVSRWIYCQELFRRPSLTVEELPYNNALDTKDAPFELEPFEPEFISQPAPLKRKKK